MRGKRLTVAQKKWLHEYGIMNTQAYLAQKNTPTLFQIKDTITGEILKFKKTVDRKQNVTLELIPTDKHGKEVKNPLRNCGYYDPRYGPWYGVC